MNLPFFTISFLVGASLQFPCNQKFFSSVLPKNTKINYVQYVVPGGGFADAENSAPQNATLPGGCALGVKVPTSLSSAYNAAYFLPDEFSNRFMVIGSGGFAGATNWQDMAFYSYYGAATMTNDLVGKIAAVDDASWGLGHPETTTDWAYRALHDSTILGKQIIAKAYGSPVKYSYYGGCSTGGRQGLMEAQRYPDDFDGMLLGSAAWWETHTLANFIHLGALNLPASSPGHIPGPLFSVITAEAIRQCDPQDGVTDGILMSPQTCKFNWNALLCKAGNSSNCLTRPQLSTIQEAMSDWVSKGKLIFPAFELGSDMTANMGVSTEPEKLGLTFFQNLVFNNTNWDWTTISPAIVAQSDQLIGGTVNAQNFDMSTYRKSGGKIIYYHGLADHLIPPKASTFFYQQMQKVMGTSTVDSFFRFYTIPGMRHCALSVNNAPWNIGQTGYFGKLTAAPDFTDDATHNAFLAMIDWVEKESAPNELVATNFNNYYPGTGIQSQRPFCPYPRTAKFIGGNYTLATSWKCP